MTEQEWLTSTDPIAMLAHLGADTSPRKLRLFSCACCRAIGRLWSDRSYATVAIVERVADGHLSPAAANAELGVIWAGDTEYYEHALRWVLPGYDLAALFRTYLFPSHADYFRKSDPRPDLLRCIFGNPFRPVRLWHEGLVVDETAGATLLDRRHLTLAVLALASAVYADRVTEVCEECLEAGCVRPYCETCGGTGRVETGRLNPGTLAVLADALEEAGCQSEKEVTCETCAKRPDEKNHPAGMIFVGWGHGWQVCSLCKGSTKRKISNPLLAHLRSEGPHWRGCWAVDCVTGRK